MNPEPEINIYLFNSNNYWDESHAKAVIAESQEAAIKLAAESFGDGFTDYTIEVREITPGLVLVAAGYDAASIYFEDA